MDESILKDHQKLINIMADKAEPNKNYQEILKLQRMLDEHKIPYMMRQHFDGWQIWYPNDTDPYLDAIEHFGSYGSSDDLLEIMYSETLDINDGIISRVKASEVFELINQHYYEKIKNKEVDNNEN